MNPPNVVCFRLSVIFSATPHLELVPCAVGVQYEGQCGQAFCAQWLPYSAHEKVAAGFSDGETP